VEEAQHESALVTLEVEDLDVELPDPAVQRFLEDLQGGPVVAARRLGEQALLHLALAHEFELGFESQGGSVDVRERLFEVGAESAEGLGEGLLEGLFELLQLLVLGGRGQYLVRVDLGLRLFSDREYLLNFVVVFGYVECFFELFF